MYPRFFFGSVSTLALLCSVSLTSAQSVDIAPIDVIGSSNGGRPPISERFQLPQSTASSTTEKIADTVNIVDTQDALKYLPSLFVRKRNNGDTQSVLQTRTWGVSSSARSLVYADALLISALIGNDNNVGGPRWGMISPEEINRIDVLYGPFAAAYPGNSMGGVVQISTKMPDKFEWTFKQTEAFQSFSNYGTQKTFATHNTNFSVGNKHGDFSWFVSGNYQNSQSQPLAYITNGANTLPGTYVAQNKTGAAANVVGAGGMLQTQMATVNGKFAYDFSDTLRATYRIGYWSNDAESSVQNYLTNGFLGLTGGAGGTLAQSFAASKYTINAKHLSNAFEIRTDSKSNFDWELSASHYLYLQDGQRNPFAALSGTADTYTTYGKIARMDGTNWMNIDAKGIWRPTGIQGEHEVSFGVHADRYFMNSPTYQLADWQNGPDSSATLYTYNRGTTQTLAAWAQNAWKFSPDWKLTTGARFEAWRAFDGFNYATTTNATGGILTTSGIAAPEQQSTAVSPKISLGWDFMRDWNATFSSGIATRFPTVFELYRSSTSGALIVQPNPNLKPETIYANELALTHKITDGQIRLSFFHETVANALISQTTPTASNPGISISTTSNVDLIRNLGIELAASKNNVLVDGLELAGSLTYVDGRILANSTYTGTANTIGNRVPNLPDFRATLVATYRPDDHWAISAAGRYSGKIFTTVENNDTTANVYQAFDNFVVFDAKVAYKYNNWATLDFGIDNIFDYKYTLFHTFPGRTFMFSAKVKL